MFIMCETSRKRSSVLSNHLSRLTVTSKLKRHTTWRDGQSHNAITRSCSRWGLHSHHVTMMLVSSYLAFPPLPSTSNKLEYIRRYLSVALSFKSPWLDVIQHPALWSSDFPLLDLSLAAIACLTRKTYIIITL